MTDTFNQGSSTQSAILSRRHRPRLLMDQALVLTLCHINPSLQWALPAPLYHLFLPSLPGFLNSHELLSTIVVLFRLWLGLFSKVSNQNHFALDRCTHSFVFHPFLCLQHIPLYAYFSCQNAMRATAVWQYRSNNPPARWLSVVPLVQVTDTLIWLSGMFKIT